jgi:hypothetical protein
MRRGDLVLLDLWAKLSDEPEAVYYDITWMAFCGDEVPERCAGVRGRRRRPRRRDPPGSGRGGRRPHLARLRGG